MSTMAWRCYDLGVTHTKYIAFVKTVRGDNCVQVSIQSCACARMVLYSSLEDWAGCCRYYSRQRMVSRTASPSPHGRVCSLGSWGRDARVDRGYDETYAGSPESFRRLIFAVAAGRPAVVDVLLSKSKETKAMEGSRNWTSEKKWLRNPPVGKGVAR